MSLSLLRVRLLPLMVAGNLGCLGQIGDAAGPETQEPKMQGSERRETELPPEDRMPEGRQPKCDPAVLDAGRTPLTRIANTQYTNAVRDLLAPLQVPDLGAMLVPESGLGGFRSNAEVPVLENEFRTYAAAAESAAALVTGAAAEFTGCSAGAPESACMASFIDRFARRAYRRPIRAAERTALVGVYSAVRAVASFPEAASAVVEAILQSPYFLYRVEETGGAAPNEVVALDDFAIASRLAFFLWDTTPDESLLAAAEAGELGAPEQIGARAAEMLDDPRAARAMGSFHTQWLGVADLETAEKDAPEFSPAVARRMLEETERFTDEVVRAEKGSFTSLLTADFTFLKGELFPLYGLSASSGSEWTRVDLDPSTRAGVLTQPSFLSAHSHADQTSPVFRGKTIRENFFCETMPPPPIDVNDTPPEIDPTLSTRERYSAYLETERCRNCHIRMDPMGLAFERYDEIGRFRDVEAGLPIDSSGRIEGTDVGGELTGVMDLASRLAQSPQAHDCLVRNWTRFALSRLEEDEADACSLERLYERFDDSGLNIHDLIVGLVQTDAFRHVKRGE